MQNSRVLIIEDDPLSGALLSGWARSLGATPVMAGSTAEADLILGADEIDLILCDVHLPGNDGLCWVERVLSVLLPPPLVLVTSTPGLETTLRAANLPVAGYLVKPPDLKALTALAQRIVLEYRRRRELRALSEEAGRLLVQPDRELDPLRAKLLALTRQLSAEAERNPRTVAHSSGHAGWHLAISDAIATLEKTKDSFRSKELGRLRQRLQAALSSDEAA